MTIKTQSGIIHLRSRPAADVAPNWLWVHPYTLDGSVWEPIWEQMPEAAHTALDLPGHGLSEPMQPNTSLDTFARAVLEVAEKTGASVLIGQSFGGTVALQAAILAPDRFEQIVLASPSVMGGPEDRECADCNQELIRLAQTRGRGPWLTERWMSVPPRIFEGTLTRPLLREGLREIVNRHRWDELLTPVFSKMHGISQTPKAIGRITGRISLLVAEHDMPAFVRSAELIRRVSRRATVDYLPHCCHLTILEEPAQGTKWIRRTMSLADFKAGKIVQCH